MSDPDDRAPVRLARTVLYESPWVNLYRDRAVLPTGRILEQYHFLDLGRAVVVIVGQTPMLGGVVVCQVGRV